jgi:hypothetical protein
MINTDDKVFPHGHLVPLPCRIGQEYVALLHSYRVYLVRGRIWPVYSLALAYQVTSAVWRLAGRLPSRLLQKKTTAVSLIVTKRAYVCNHLVYVTNTIS